MLRCGMTSDVYGMEMDGESEVGVNVFFFDVLLFLITLKFI